jgi:hypothetical protein
VVAGSVARSLGTFCSAPWATGSPFLVLWQPVYSPGQYPPLAIVDAISGVVRAGPDIVEAAAAKLLEAP